MDAATLIDETLVSAQQRCNSERQVSITSGIAGAAHLSHQSVLLQKGSIYVTVNV